jgi:sugar phosphate isomerase/epimerase
MADTVAFLSWVLSQSPSLTVALELLPREPDKYKIGQVAADLMEALRRVGSPRLALCWDLGHVARNALLGDDAPLPRGFLRRLHHVHVHDVDAEGVDHYPLIYGNVPLARCFRQLKRAGFSGAVVLELNGHRLARLGGDGAAMIAASFRRLSVLGLPD